ncbi:MAG: efflux RND transporter permease subunit [Geminicoccaceae bacterium]
MISEFFIDRPIFANVIGIIFIVLGLVALQALPVAQYPNITPPTIQVSTNYPGASAATIAQTVGIPLENAVNGTENAIYYSSTSSSAGQYTLTISFSVGTDLDKALSLVQNSVSGALSQLPQSVYQQGVTVKQVSTNILLVVSLYSDDDRFDETYLSNYAVINLQYPVGRLPGVGQVNVLGAGPYAMRIWLDPQKLQTYGLSIADVQQAVQAQTTQITGGQLGVPPVPPTQTFQLTIDALGRLSDVEQFENIIVKTVAGDSSTSGSNTAQLVRIKDIARVELSQQDFSNFAGLSGHKAGHLIIYSLPGANALSTAKAVRDQIQQLSGVFPQGLKYGIVFDTTTFIGDAINAVYQTLIEAGILVLIVIMMFLQSFRAVLVPATTVPVTIIGAFAAMAALGFSINLMTLFALILAIGIVVDDAIVVVENSSHFIETGMSPRDSAAKAMSELIGPILGVTLVLTAVFLPAAFLPGITGQLFRQFALVIAATAVISAINAMTLKPAQCASFLRPPKPGGPSKLNRILFGWFDGVFNFLQRIYVGVVRFMVGHAFLFMLVFFAIVGLAGWQFTKVPTGFLPDEDQGYCIIAAELPPGASRPRVQAVADKITAVLKEAPGITGWVTMGGYSILDSASIPQAIAVFPVYQSFAQRGDKLTQEVIVGNLRRQLAAIQEAFVMVVIPPAIPGIGQSGGFQMMLQDRAGLGLAELQKATQALLAAARDQTGLLGVATTFSANSPQLFLDINRTQMESSKVSMNDLTSAIEGYLGSSFVNFFNKFGQVFQIYLQADAPYRLNTNDLLNLYAKSQTGEMVPFGALMDVRTQLSADLVTRYNLYDAAPIFGGAAPGFSSGQSLSLMEQAAAQSLPRGTGYEWTGMAYQEKLIGNQAYFIYALSILLVYLVLAAQYESWLNPLAVIAAVPMAMVGVLAALMIRDFDNNLYTQIGLVLMIALAAKNAILVVEFARDLRKEGKEIAEAAVEATHRRFRPVMMTSIAFTLGVVPLLTATGAGAASQQAIGTVVFGGMIASTFLALPFVPVFYVLTEKLSERFSGGGKAATTPPPAAAPAQT